MTAPAIADPSTSSRAEGIVTCSVGDEQFVLRGTDACEIVRAERIRRSTTAGGFVGTLSVNREPVPVYALSAALGRTGPPRGNHVVVTRGSAGMVGWLVDRIARPAPSDRARIIPLPAIVGRPATTWFEGLVAVGDGALLMLSPAHLDPRATGRPERADDRANSRPTRAADADDEAGSPLVLLFSSPAFPPCSAARFALSARRIAAVIQSQPVTVVPGSASHVTGVIVWRDVAVPVIDVRSVNGRGTASDDRLLVARCGAALNGSLVAFAIGSDVTLHEPTRADRKVDEDGHANPPFVTGVFGVAGSAVALLNLELAIEGLVGSVERRPAT